MIRSCLYQLNEQQRKVQFSNYFLPLQLSLNSVVVSAVAFHPGDPGSISGHTFKLSFVFQLLRQVSWRKVQKEQQPLRITQILSPERASVRKGMSSKEGFIWVNLSSLVLRHFYEVSESSLPHGGISKIFFLDHFSPSFLGQKLYFWIQIPF